MSMKVEVINSAKELEELSPFHVECLLWGTKEIPATYGYMGFVPGDGFYIKMVCEEKDPLRAYENDLDPVYRDSAMGPKIYHSSRTPQGQAQMALSWIVCKYRQNVFGFFR